MASDFERDFERDLGRRDVVESAVGLLASRHDEDIPAARARLHRLARHSGVSLANVAHVILAGECARPE